VRREQHGVKVAYLGGFVVWGRRQVRAQLGPFRLGPRRLPPLKHLYVNQRTWFVEFSREESSESYIGNDKCQHPSCWIRDAVGRKISGLGLDSGGLVVIIRN